MTDMDRFSAPDGFSWGSFKNAEGANIRYGHVSTSKPLQGIAVMLTGFRESIEKYFESARDLLSRGFDVWMMDWMDQGGSDRYLPDAPQKSYSKGFNIQLDTLHSFMRDVVKNPQHKPLVMMAHSMGGHLGLRYLARHTDVFKCAVVTAPMIDISTGKIPRAVVKFFSGMKSKLLEYAPNEGDWNGDRLTFDGNNKTSDPVRFKALNDIYLNNESLRKGGATFGWGYHALESIAALALDLPRIKTPVLMQTSGRDTIVLTGAQALAAAAIPHCRRIDIPEAQHEIWSERDPLRDIFLREVDRFLDQQLKPQARPGNAPRF